MPRIDVSRGSPVITVGEFILSARDSSTKPLDTENTISLCVDSIRAGAHTANGDGSCAACPSRQEAAAARADGNDAPAPVRDSHPTVRAARADRVAYPSRLGREEEAMYITGGGILLLVVIVLLVFYVVPRRRG